MMSKESSINNTSASIDNEDDDLSEVSKHRFVIKMIAPITTIHFVAHGLKWKFKLLRPCNRGSGGFPACLYYDRLHYISRICNIKKLRVIVDFKFGCNPKLKKCARGEVELEGQLPAVGALADTTDLWNFLDENRRLVIEVNIQIYKEKKRTIWNPSTEELLPDKNELPDVGLLVGGTTFLADRCILKHRVPALYELLQRHQELQPQETEEDSEFCNKSQPLDVIEIPGVSASTFKILLLYLYDGTFPTSISDCSVAKEVLIFADRFQCIQLKLYMEWEILVTSNKLLKQKNVTDWLSFADSYSLPMLKQVCMDMWHANNEAEMKASIGWKKTDREMLPDLLLELRDYNYCSTTTCSLWKYTTTIPRGEIGDSSDHEYESMSVARLRERIDESLFGTLELLDGTHKMLIQQMNDHHQSATSTTSG